jgi:hypothetical protein
MKRNVADSVASKPMSLETARKDANCRGIKARRRRKIRDFDPKMPQKTIATDFRRTSTYFTRI